MENTISAIVSSNNSTVPIPQNFEEVVINLYKSTVSEELYDTYDIATAICENLLSSYEYRMDNRIEKYTMIYNVFDICKRHVVRENVLYDAKQMLDRDAQKSADYLRGLIAPR